MTRPRARPRVLAIVQAGGAGGRMDVLTRERAKPALPVAGVFQLVDFPLSNLTHSGIGDVWLSVQFQGGTLEEEVANGRPWDLDRTRGGLRLLMPEEGTGSLDEEGFARGNADELYRLRHQVAGFGADVLLVMSADHVYTYDYTELVAAHLDRGAECTLLTSEVDPSEAGDHGVVEADGEGLVTGFAYKPDRPATSVVSTEVIAYDPTVLVEVLEELHRELGADSPAGDSGLEDFGDHLVPRLVERGRTRALALDGYWRDLGEPHKYLRAHHDLLLDDQGVLGRPDWPILTRQPQRSPARLRDGADVVDSLLAPGCQVAGSVHRSVIGPGVVVEEGAVVTDSVLFADSVVRARSAVHDAVVDVRCRVGAGALVGAPRETPSRPDPEHVVLLGRECTVGEGVVLEPGARLEPGTTA